MRISFLILVSLVIGFGCKKAETINPPCISHSNLSLSLSDSMMLSNCDSRLIFVRIHSDSNSTYLPLNDSTMNQNDTAYVHFNSIGDYTLYYGLGMNRTTGRAYKKQIRVN